MDRTKKHNKLGRPTAKKTSAKQYRQQRVPKLIVSEAPARRVHHYKMAGVQKAWFYDRHGTLDVLQFGEFPLPIPGPGQLLIQVRAAALNPADFKIREGAFRSSDFDLPAVPGFDVSGVVAGVGAGVTKFREGDHVYGDVQDLTAEKPRRLGTLAQYTLAEESLFALKPPNLSFEEAASLPVALLTALQGFDIATFQKDQTVLIVGGAGGVGSLAVQVAKHVYGASRVVATASTGKLEFVKSLGADDVVDYTKQSYHQIPEKFDFVFDTIGESFESHVVAKEGAKILDIAKLQPHPKAEFFMLTPAGSNLERVREYIESGKIKAVLDPKSPFAFSEVIEAFKLQESGRARGKVVISPIE